MAEEGCQDDGRLLQQQLQSDSESNTSGASEEEGSEGNSAEFEDEDIEPATVGVGDNICQILQGQLHSRISPCHGTVLQECYYKLRSKLLHNLSDKAVNADLKRNAAKVEAALHTGQQNLYPRSLHIVKKLLDIKQSQDYEYHVCTCD